MTFIVSESSTDQYQRGDGGTGVGVEVGSGVKVAVAVFSTGTTSAGWDVDVASTCSTGADVDMVGFAQADRNVTIANNSAAIRFMVPLI
jgi:acyl-[acyl carrier protein]--UDP-N-acetylglucosamine O-acyltransferase